jgi:hypothetical protein
LDLVLAGLDPFDNAQRGHLVQALVANAIGGRLTQGWHEYDIDAPGGLRIEVKSTATVQCWPAGPRGYRPGWSLPRRRGWNSQTNVMRAEAGRWADLYVLHLLNADECVLEQWLDPARHEFFVLRVCDVEQERPKGTLTLSVPEVRRLAPSSSLADLAAAVSATLPQRRADGQPR